MFLQRTVKKEISCKSVGLHSGRKILMSISPAEVDDGIVFVRKDMTGKNTVRADVHNVVDTTLATTIASGGVAVSTVEHLMSAFSGMGVDNAIVGIDAAELPIMDGSARPFVELLKNVGTKVQGKAKKLLVITKNVSVAEGDGSAMFLPSPEFQITYDIHFNHKEIGSQLYHFKFSDVSYENEICDARTFGFLRDVEYLQARGLALGGSLKNAIVLDDNRIINKEGLRCPDEFVRHKILDAIGDLSLLGIPIIGHFVASRSGHRLNNLLLKELLKQPESWTIVNNYSRDEMFVDRHRLSLPVFNILDSAPAPTFAIQDMATV
jgi:UDP-3-O-[3-hydroxymyristoyl] N-acetylglucosamine deacetylase